MRWLLAAALALGTATTIVVSQAATQIQIYARVLDGTGAPAKSLRVGDVHVMENGPTRQ
jgi:hypothetical protein